MKKTSTEPTKFFVVIRDGRCLGRVDPVSDNNHYAYTSRRWAEKFAEKRGGDVFSVQGFDLVANCNLHWTWPGHRNYCHYAIAEEAERLFCAN